MKIEKGDTVFVGTPYSSSLGYEITTGPYVVTASNRMFTILDDIYVTGTGELEPHLTEPPTKTNTEPYHALLLGLPRREFSEREFASSEAALEWLIMEIEDRYWTCDRDAFRAMISGPCPISVSTKVIVALLGLDYDDIPDQVVKHYRGIQDILDRGRNVVVGYRDEQEMIYTEYDVRDHHTETLMALTYPDMEYVWLEKPSA